MHSTRRAHCPNRSEPVTRTRSLVPTVLLVAGLLGNLLGCTSDQSSPNSPNLHFEETLRIGSDDPEAPDHQLFSQVAAATVDSSGAIYAVDAQTGGVRVYDEGGTFQRSFGTRGQGPGEFQGASALHIDAHGRLLVADPGQSRITAYSRSGEVLDTYSLPGVRRVTDMAPLPRGRYALAGAGKGHLVHVVDSTFSTVEARLVSRSSVQATDHKLGTVIKPYFAGSVAVVDDGRLVYAPGFHTGPLRVFNETDTTWTQTATYESSGGRDTPVTITKLDNAERVDLPIQMQNGQFAAQMHALSWGLHTPPGKGLVHVFAQETDAGLELTVERFTRTGTHRGATVVDTASALNLTPLAMDVHGNLYLSDTREVPQLRRLSWTTKD